MYTERLLWKHYKHICWELTNKQDIALLENSEKRGNSGFERGSGYYHLDHIVPIRKGFLMGIPPFLIASMDNLRFIPSEDNIKKNVKLTDESYKVLKQWGIDADYSQYRIKEWYRWKKYNSGNSTKFKSIEGFDMGILSYPSASNQQIIDIEKLLNENRILKQENQSLKRDNSDLKRLVELMKEEYYGMRIIRNKINLGIIEKIT